jgi:hypothetical protein
MSEEQAMVVQIYGWVCDYATGRDLRPASHEELVRSFRSAIAESGHPDSAAGVFEDEETGRAVYVTGETCRAYDLALRECAP